MFGQAAPAPPKPYQPNLWSIFGQNTIEKFQYPMSVAESGLQDSELTVRNRSH
jgi:hypothetical protein